MAKKRAADKAVAIVWFDDAASRFRITPDTLRLWIAEGRFPAARGEGARLFYTEKDLEDVVGFLGRWRPQEAAGSSRKEPERAVKSRKEQDVEGSEGKHG